MISLLLNCNFILLFFLFSAHPKIKVFVTQGGIHSIEEAVHNGVPMVGIPFLGDQTTNVKTFTELGIGLKIDSNYITKESLMTSILEVARNERYIESAKMFKKIAIVSLLIVFFTSFFIEGETVNKLYKLWKADCRFSAT